MSLIKSNTAGLGGSGSPGGSLGSFYSHTLDQSLRFNRGSDSKLVLDPTGGSSGVMKFTISLWFKRTTLGVSQTLFSGEQGAVAYDMLNIGSNDQLQITMQNPNSYGLKPNMLFRDVGAWYHCVVEGDSSLGSAGDRVKIYINGDLQTLSSIYGNYPGNHNWYWNRSSSSQNIGRSEYNGNSLDGYLAEFHFIDGTAYDADTFGERKDGVWIPKEYSGSHGNNGFYLSFADSSAIGDDLSGNGNDFTATNLSAHDVVPDSPTKNFAVMNPLMIGDDRVHSSASYSEGNLNVAGGGFSTSTIGGGYSTIAIPKDKKIYIEVCETGIDGNYWAAGILIDHHVQNNTQVSGDGAISAYNRQVYVNGVETDYGSSAGLGGLGVAKMSAGDVLGVAVDGATGKVWFHLNGTYFKSPSTNDSGTTGNPSAGTNEIGTVNNTASNNPSGEIFFFINNHQSSDNCRVNFGQDSTFAGSKSAGSQTDSNGDGLFQYAVPTDYVCLHSGNMSNVTIGPGQTSQADDHFDTKLYEATGSTLNITGINFQPDWIWAKRRDGVQEGRMTDSVRGVNAQLRPAATNVETTFTNAVTSFNSDGFTLGVDTGPGSQSFNYYTDSHVAWVWKGGGSASSNSNGTITSSVSANQDAGFSIVSYTGTGSNGTIGHGLSSAPESIWIKARTRAEAWLVYHKFDGGTDGRSFLNLDVPNAKFDNGPGSYFQDTPPTASVFYQNTSSYNQNTDTYIAYCFHSVEGYSKLGRYTGNNSADGPFTYTGFSPAWLLLKRADSSASWLIYDNKRDTYNHAQYALFPDNANAEYTSNLLKVDFLSNGFKIRNATYGETNADGATYIFLAFAEAPFKFANAR